MKQKTFQMRVDETELNELKELALSRKMTVAQYIRFCVEQDKKMSKPISKKVNGKFANYVAGRNKADR